MMNIFTKIISDDRQKITIIANNSLNLEGFSETVASARAFFHYSSVFKIPRAKQAALKSHE
jgi:hypothetical protein